MATAKITRIDNNSFTLSVTNSAKEIKKLEETKKFLDENPEIVKRFEIIKKSIKSSNPNKLRLPQGKITVIPPDSIVEGMFNFNKYKQPKK